MIWVKDRDELTHFKVKIGQSNSKVKMDLPELKVVTGPPKPRVEMSQPNPKVERDSIRPKINTMRIRSKCWDGSTHLNLQSRSARSRPNFKTWWLRLKVETGRLGANVKLDRKSIWVRPGQRSRQSARVDSQDKSA